MAMVQGVWQVPPSDDRASTPGGFDWISSPVVVGFALNASKPEELQAASAKPQITRAKARSSFISAFPRAAECRHPVACATIVPRSSLRANYRAASDRGRYSRWPARLLKVYLTSHAEYARSAARALTVHVLFPIMVRGIRSRRTTCPCYRRRTSSYRQARKAGCVSFV
jgi:hypothetical protein